MTALFVSAASEPWGAERSLLILTRELNRLGHDVALLCQSDSLAQQWRNEVNSQIEFTRRRSRSAVGRAAQLGFRICRARRGSTVVLFSYELLAIAPVLRLLRSDLNLVWDIHDMLSGPKAQFFLRVLTPFIHMGVAVSAWTGTQMKRGRIAVLARPVNIPGPITMRRSDGPIQVGIVGRMDSDKGHRLLFSAAAPLREDLRIVARGRPGIEGPEAAADIARDGTRLLGNSFEWQGEVPHAEVMTGLDVLVVANPREPLGRTILEAQAAGVVVIVPDSGGASELVVDGVTGLKFGRSRSLRDCLQGIQDPHMRRELAAAARVAVEQNSPTNYSIAYAEAIRIT